MRWFTRCTATTTTRARRCRCRRAAACRFIQRRCAPMGPRCLIYQKARTEAGPRRLSCLFRANRRVSRALWMQSVTMGWGGAQGTKGIDGGSVENKNFVSLRSQALKKKEVRRKIQCSHLMHPWNHEREGSKGAKKKTQMEERANQPLQLFRRLTSSFLRWPTVAGLDASAALWFVRPFLYRTTGSSAPGSKPLWSRTSGVWSPDPLAPPPHQHTVVTHELPCCSLTSARYYWRRWREKQHLSIFSGTPDNKAPGLAHDKRLFPKKTSVF